MSVARLRCGLLGLILFSGAATADSGDRFESFATVAVEGASESRLQSPGNFAVQAGLGCELKPLTSLELMAGYHWLGDVYYSYGGLSPNVDSHVRLIPITLNLTRRFRSLAVLHPYVTFGTGYYAIHYDRIWSQAPNRINFTTGFNGGVGLKGPPGRFAARIDARAHFVSLPGETRYDLTNDRDFMRLWVLAAGVQFP